MRTVRATVDHQRAGTADSFAAVVIERDCFKTFANQFLVQYIEHLEERCFVADAVDAIALEFSSVAGAVLPPDLEDEIFEVAHL